MKTTTTKKEQKTTNETIIMCDIFCVLSEIFCAKCCVVAGWRANESSFTVDTVVLTLSSYWNRVRNSQHQTNRFVLNRIIETIDNSIGGMNGRVNAWMRFWATEVNLMNETVEFDAQSQNHRCVCLFVVAIDVAVIVFVARANQQQLLLLKQNKMNVCSQPESSLNVLSKKRRAQTKAKERKMEKKWRTLEKKNSKR